MTSKDRLRDLNQQIQNDSVLDMPLPPELSEIYDKVQIIKGWIITIQENTSVIKNLIRSCSNNISTKPIQNEIEKRVKNTMSLSSKICNKLKDFDKKSNSDKTTVERIKKVQYALLRQEFQNAIFENNEILENYRDTQKNLLSKQAALVRSSLNEEELEALLNDPNKIQLFTGNILSETQLAKQQLSQIEERHEELLKIEGLLQEIRDQFFHLAILVEQQKDHVNRIEFQALDASNFVDEGVAEIQNANRKKRKIRKVYIITIFIVVFFLIIFTLLIK